MKFDTKKIIEIVIVVAIVIVLVIIIGILGKKYLPAGSLGQGVGTTEQGTVTRETSPKDIIVPDENSGNLPENIARPRIVGSGNPTNDSSYRSFVTKIEGGKFM